MTKWLVALVIVILAPTFVINLFTNGVNFISTQSKVFTSEVIKEATKTIERSKE